jgi:hypothetical protein
MRIKYPTIIPAKCSSNPLIIATCIGAVTALSGIVTFAQTTCEPQAAPMAWTNVFPGEKPGEWFPRPLPLTELPITRTINAADFGAIPDDGQCDADAIRKAFEALRNAPGTKLMFESGTYDLIKPRNNAFNASIFSLNGLRDVEIDFGGALMLVRTPSASFMEILNTENLIIGNFSLDYDPLPYTIGKVLATHTVADAVAFDFEILDGYLLPDDPFFLSYLNLPNPTHGGPGMRTWGYFIDPHHPGRIKPNTSNVHFMEKVEPIAERVYRYFVDRSRGGPNLNSVEVGDIFNYLTRGGGAFIIRQSKQVTLRDAILYANGGANVQGTYNDCLNFLRVHIKIKEGRWKTSNADGFIFHSLAFAPWFEGCTTEGMSDDTINVHIRPHFINEIVDARTLRLGPPEAAGSGRKFNPDDFTPGDRVSFFNGPAGQVFFEAYVTAIDLESGAVIFDRDLPQLTMGPQSLKHTSVYNTARSRGVVIRDNFFRGARRHGVLLRTHDALIENNVFEGLSSDAIHIANESGWPEGLFGRNILIRNNTFIDCGFETQYIYGGGRATISFGVSNPPKPPQGVIAHQNIVIEDNIFEGWYRRAILLAHADNVIIRNNKVGAPRKPFAQNRPNEAFVVLQHCGEVIIEDNTLAPDVIEVGK